jgi:Family of unknown function (DUF5765)
MCFNADMSLSLGIAGVAAAAWTFADTEEQTWVRAARAYAIFHFSLMEFIQYFAYPVADQCGYGSNLLLTELSTYHIDLQAFAIMPALATYSSDKRALRKAAIIGACLSGFFILCSLLPRSWQLFGIQPNFIGDMLGCLYKGIYHIGYAIPSALGLLVTHGSLFGLALSGFLWKDNWRIANYHLAGALLTLFIPQWLFGVSTGEAAAIYCLFSIPITISFCPLFKTFFMAKPHPAT